MQVPVGDNYYAALNSAVFSDGSFVYIPKGVKSAMELSTYFRINAQETGQVSSSVGSSAQRGAPVKTTIDPQGLQHDTSCCLCLHTYLESCVQ